MTHEDQARDTGQTEYRRLREEMVETQLVARKIASPAVLEAMRHVPREAFVPSDLKSQAYQDRALPIDCGQTISQPYMVALTLEALELTGGECVLEIGTGSGYLTALLSRLAGSVISIERHRVLADAARLILTGLGVANVTVRCGDGSLGWPQAAPYRRIVVSAAGFQVPPSLIEQLADPGLLVLPEGDRQSQVLRQYRLEYGAMTSRDLCPCRFVPLLGDEGFSTSGEEDSSSG